MTTTQGMIGTVSLGSAPDRYDRQDQDQMRRTLERTLQRCAPAEPGAPAIALPWLNPTDFGSMSDDVAFDNEPTIQAALDQAYANHSAAWNGAASVVGTDARTSVLLPQAGGNLGWTINKPLWMRGGCAFKGYPLDPQYGPTSNLRMNFEGGYGLVVTSGTDKIDNNIIPPAGPYSPRYYHAALWSDLGFDASHDTDQAPNKAYFDLRECCKALDLHGLSQFCIEMEFKADTHSVADGVFLASRGRWRASESVAAQNGGAFALAPIADGIFAELQTSTGRYTTTKAAPGTGLLDGTEKVLCLDYDGAHLRVFLNGTLIDSVACTGTVVQHDAEGVFLGQVFSLMPYRQSISAGITGKYGIIRISNTSRHTASYVAGAPTGFDANTIFQVDWYNTKGPMVRASTQAGFCWMLRRNGAAPQSAPGMNDVWQKDTYGFSIENIIISPIAYATVPAKVNGIYFTSSGGTRFRIRDTHLTGGVRVGLAMGNEGNAYGSEISRMLIQAWNGRYSMICNHNVGLSSSISGLWLSGGKVVLASIGGMSIRDSFIEEVGGDGWWFGPGTPDRADGGAGTKHGIVHYGGDIDNELILDGVHMGVEAGAYDLQSSIVVVHGGLGNTKVTARSCGFQQFSATTHVLDTSQDTDPIIAATMPWFELDTEHHTQIYGPNYRGGASISLLDCGFHLWGAFRTVEELIRAVGDGEFMPCEVKNPRFEFVAPKAISTKAGVASLITVGGVGVLPCVAGTAIAVDNVVHSVSAANVSTKAFSIAVGAGANGALFVAISYVMNAGVARQSLQVGVSPFNVTHNATSEAAYLPVASYVNGDVITEIWVTQDHTLGSTVDIQVDMTGLIGAGKVLALSAVSLLNVNQGDLLEGFSIWKSQVTGSHTVHQDTYESLRPDCLALDWIVGTPGVFVADGGQTTHFAVNTGLNLGYAVSSKVLAAAARSTMGWTLPSSSMTSDHITMVVRPAIITFDALRHSTFVVTLDKNVTNSHLVNMYEDQEITIIIKQDGVGGRTFVWPANVSGAPAVAAGANAVTIVKLFHTGSSIVAK